MAKVKDLTFQRFNKLFVVHYNGIYKRSAYWLCRCDCGNLVNLRAGKIKQGETKSCGCLQRNQLKTHGLYKHPLYSTWENMKTRCLNPNSPVYKNYGARGITICDRWMEFENFYEDMAPSHQVGLQLDRIDNEKGYSPENCRWATAKENANNKRTNVYINTPAGHMTLAQAARAYGINHRTLRARYHNGWPEDRLLQPTGANHEY